MRDVKMCWSAGRWCATIALVLLCAEGKQTRDIGLTPIQVHKQVHAQSYRSLSSLMCQARTSALHWVEYVTQYCMHAIARMPFNACNNAAV